MKAKKLLAGILSATMVLSAMALPAFADETQADDAVVLTSSEEGAAQNVETDETGTVVAKIGDTEYTDLATALNEAKKGDIVELQENITLTGEWTPIKERFEGTLDGNGKTISGLTIATGNSNVGLFSSLYGGTVKNLTIDGANINTSAQYVGGLCGSGWGTIENCKVSNSIVIGKDQVGGLVGYWWIGTISNCSLTDNMITATEERAGGILGKGHTDSANSEDGISITNCTVSGGSATAPDYAGGLMGQFMGNQAAYSITGNQVENFALSANKGISAFATIREGQNDNFMGALQDNLTSNTLEAVIPSGGNWVENNNGGYVNCVAEINDNYYSSLKDAFKAAKSNDTITLFTDEITTCPTEKDLPAAEGVTIVGVEGKTTIYGLASLNAESKYLTFKNIEFSQTTDTLKIQGNGITFENCDFNAHTLTWDDAKASGLNQSWYSIALTKLGGDKAAENIIFDGCNFDSEGKDGELSAMAMIWNPCVINLTIKNCSLESTLYGIYYGGSIRGDLKVEDSTINAASYALNAGGEGALDLTVKNSTLNGWTSYSSTDKDNHKAIFENCNFGGVIGGEAQLVGYVSTDFTGCTFAKDFKVDVEAPEDEQSAKNIVWNIKDCDRDGTALLNGKSFFNEQENWKKITVNFASSEVRETAKATGATITLNNLASQEKINLGDDSSYKVVVATAPQADVEKANAKIAEEETGESKNTSKQIFDISVYKTDSQGTSKDVSSAISQQQVTITLGETPNANTVKVYHVGSTETEKISNITVKGNTITFIAPSFSTYAVTYTADDIEDNEISKQVGVAFERVDASSTYDIVLKALDGKKINRFMSADLTFALDVESGAVGYTVEPGTNIYLIDNNNGRYEFNLNGTVASGATGSDIVIGQVTFDGTGKIKFSVDTAVETNIVNSAEATDNIVDDYTTGGNGTITGLLKLNSDVTNGTIDEEFKAETADLTINIDFPNAIKDNANAYQKMTVTISGGDLTDNVVYKLGSGEGETALNTDGKYVIDVADKLTKNVAYTVKVEGAGYRTARYTVNMTGAKTLDFWNNVKDTAINVDESVTDASTAKKVTFLAGDIVKDNQINIYDLSAVVSYFGQTGIDVTAESNYAKYDLNRDGKIDSKDIAYVLVSWGN